MWVISAANADEQSGSMQLVEVDLVKEKKIGVNDKIRKDVDKTGE